MFGSHLSIAGGMHNALIEAKSLSLDCVQVFTKNQRQWKASPLSDEQIRLWDEHRRSTGIAAVVSHASYLINPASPVADAWEKSIALFRDELTRCEALGIQNLVIHPGAHVGSGESAGLARVAAALDRLHADLPGFKVVTCLEITAGQGTCLGARFEHLAQIIDQTRQPERVAVCLDTAHLFEAGYDLTSGEGAAQTMAEFDRVIGRQRLRAWHVNDSKTPRGSRVDRHEHIGKGLIASDALAVILRDPRNALIPKIMETPKGAGPNGKPWDTVNLEVLVELARGKKKADSKKAGSKTGR